LKINSISRRSFECFKKINEIRTEKTQKEEKKAQEEKTNYLSQYVKIRGKRTRSA
jgi:hypothetical protein